MTGGSPMQPDEETSNSPSLLPLRGRTVASRKHSSPHTIPSRRDREPRPPGDLDTVGSRLMPSRVSPAADLLHPRPAQPSLKRKPRSAPRRPCSPTPSTWGMSQASHGRGAWGAFPEQQPCLALHGAGPSKGGSLPQPSSAQTLRSRQASGSPQGRCDPTPDSGQRGHSRAGSLPPRPPP